MSDFVSTIDVRPQLNILEYRFDDYNMVFYCYNSSWISQKKEQYGLMYFPHTFYSKELFKHKANLIISILHHPFNWQNNITSRDFKAHIEKTSDIILTGHEHVASKKRADDFDGNYIQYIEGSVLQDHDNIENSGFNVILLDLINEQQQIHNYQWNGKIYSPLKSSDGWIEYKRSKSNHKRTFELNTEFEMSLNDAGASFTHPHKSHLFLEDFFVFPNLRDLNLERTDDVLTEKVIEASILFKINKTMNKVLLVGAEKSGKSTLCKVLFKHYYNYGYIPVYIDGHKIKSASIDDFNKLIDNCFKDQYSDDTIEMFKQLENDKKILLIDDFDNARLNSKYKSVLLNSMTIYPNVIITGNELFQVEEIVYEEGQKKSVFKDYQQFEIREFGHLLRSKLINKWNILGQEQYMEESELTRKDDYAKQVIDTIIGKNFVPSYPVFLLTILQSIEAGTPHNLKESAYGHYYGYLITQALSKLKITHNELDTYYNYIIELAYLFFKNKISEISNGDLVKFHDGFCKEYSIRLNLNEVIKHLLAASIIDKHEDTFKFRYKYIYYFFAAKYLSNNISNDPIKQIISKLCKRLYREEFANIIMFLTHHSKDPFILDEILLNAKSIFFELEPIKLEEDISIVNNLLKEIPKLVLEDRDINQSRENLHRIQDEAELNAEKSEIENDSYDYNEDIIDLDIMPKLNLAFKTVEIIGQVLKNYYGSLKGTLKLSLCEEAYFVGLRSLNSFFKMLNENTDAIVNEIKAIIEKEKLIEGEKVEEVSRELLFNICELISYAFIKRTASSIGSEKIEETFNEILKKNDYTSVQMIDISIRLDFFRTVPIPDIQRLKEKLSGNILPLILLRRMVINYLYMFPTTYKDRQKICNCLGIPMAAQRAIDITSTQKKKK